MLALVFTVSPARGLTCQELAVVVYEAQRELLGLHEAFDLEVAHRLGQDFLTSDSPEGFRQFLGEATQILEIPPAERPDRLRQFAERWWRNTQISSAQARREAEDFVWLIAGRSHGADPEALPDARIVLERLSQLGREHAIGGGAHPLTARFLWYSSNVTRLSVEEMATSTRMSVAQVRQQLTELGISLDEAFARPANWRTMENHLGARFGELVSDLPANASIYEAARYLRQRNVPMANVARALDVGELALETYLGERAIAWDRRLEFEGSVRDEIDILLTLFDRNFSIEAIRDALNHAAGAKTPRDPEFRSAISVYMKLRRLGKMGNAHRSANDLEIEGYGQVKSNGNLVPLAVLHFATENQENGAEWIAGKLGVATPSLLGFLRRQNVTLYTANGRPFGRSTLGQGAEPGSDPLAADLAHFYRTRGNRLPGHPVEPADRALTPGEKYERRLNKRLSHAFTDETVGADSRWARLLEDLPEEVVAALLRSKRTASLSSVLEAHFHKHGGVPDRTSNFYSRMVGASNSPTEWNRLLGAVSPALAERLVEWRTNADAITQKRESFAQELDEHFRRTGSLPHDQLGTPPRGEKKKTMEDLTPEQQAEQQLYKRMMKFSLDEEKWAGFYGEVSEPTTLAMFRFKMEKDLMISLTNFWVKHDGAFPKALRPADGVRRTEFEETSTNLYKKLAHVSDNPARWDAFLSRPIPDELRRRLITWHQERHARRAAR